MQTEIVKALMGAAGAVGGATYVEDVFSTYLYTGNASARSINNGIDLSGRGGLVWTKTRNHDYQHFLIDTVRGNTKGLASNTTAAEATKASNDGITSFNSNGYSLGVDSANPDGYANENNKTYASWTFRKAPGFFDVVTWTGNGTAGREIAHNLGADVGFLMVKRLDNNDEWRCWHRKLNGGTNVGQYSIVLNANDGNGTGVGIWNNTAPTSSVFTVGDDNKVNANGGTYVAYLFAHDEQSFGEGENASVIKCDSYTGNGSSTGPEINLGWEPQWVLIKRIDASENWFLWDSMRGIVTDGNDARLIVNGDGAENDSTDRVDLTSTGFKPKTVSGEVNASGGTYIYMCLRRPDVYVGKPAEAGTDVLAMDYGNNSQTIPCFDSGFPVDFLFVKNPTSSSDHWYNGSRLTGDQYLHLNLDYAESTWNDVVWDSNSGAWKDNDTDILGWMWKRHAGFDVVTYVGDRTGTNGAQTINHNLGGVPEMYIVKNRDRGYPYHWYTYHIGMNGGTQPERWVIELNQDWSDSTNASSPFWNNTAPTSTVFSLGNHNRVNNTGDEYIALLFRSIENISKVGYYTGNGSATERTFTLGFQPRFLLIKGTDTQGHNWNLLDTTRGWASGNDNVLEVNDSPAQTNSINVGQPTSTGFTLTTDDAQFNANSSNYIYFAHA